MSIYERGSLYWYDFVFDGTRHQGSTKLSNRRAAQEFENAKRAELAKERDDRKKAAERFGVKLNEVARCCSAKSGSMLGILSCSTAKRSAATFFVRYGRNERHPRQYSVSSRSVSAKR